MQRKLTFEREKALITVRRILTKLGKKEDSKVLHLFPEYQTKGMVRKERRISKLVTRKIHLSAAAKFHAHMRAAENGLEKNIVNVIHHERYGTVGCIRCGFCSYVRASKVNICAACGFAQARDVGGAGGFTQIVFNEPMDAAALRADQKYLQEISRLQGELQPKKPPDKPVSAKNKRKRSKKQPEPAVDKENIKRQLEHLNKERKGLKKQMKAERRKKQ